MINDDAGSTAVLLGIGGVLGTAVGLSITWVSWPHEYGEDAGFGVLLGLGIVSISQLALLAVVIAWAVQLGIRWSGLASEISYATRPRPVNGPGRSAPDLSQVRSLDEE